MRRTLAASAFLGALLLSLPALASVWVTNRTAAAFTLQLQCRESKSAQHVIEANTAASYSVPKGARGCQITVLDAESKSPISRVDIEDGLRYEIGDGGKITKR
jgi:hypothetical protein